LLHAILRECPTVASSLARGGLCSMIRAFRAAAPERTRSASGAWPLCVGNDPVHLHAGHSDLAGDLRDRHPGGVSGKDRRVTLNQGGGQRISCLVQAGHVIHGGSALRG